MQAGNLWSARPDMAPEHSSMCICLRHALRMRRQLLPARRSSTTAPALAGRRMWGGSITRMWRTRGRSMCHTRRARLRRHRPRRRRRCRRQRRRRRQGQRRRRRPCRRRRRRRPRQRRRRHPQRRSLRRCRRMARRQRRRAALPRRVWRGCRARRGGGVRRRQCRGRGPTACLVTWSSGRTEPPLGPIMICSCTYGKGRSAKMRHGRAASPQLFWRGRRARRCCAV